MNNENNSQEDSFDIGEESIANETEFQNNLRK